MNQKNTLLPTVPSAKMLIRKIVMLISGILTIRILLMSIRILLWSIMNMLFDMYVLLRERNLDVVGVERVVDALEHVADDV